MSRVSMHGLCGPDARAASPIETCMPSRTRVAERVRLRRVLERHGIHAARDLARRRGAAESKEEELRDSHPGRSRQTKLGSDSEKSSADSK